jgi:hypothetical protein
MYAWFLRHYMYVEVIDKLNISEQNNSGRN